MKTYTAYFNYIIDGITLSEEVVKLICRSGDNTEDVRRCLELPEVKAEMLKIPRVAIVEELKEYGAWEDEELPDEQKNLEKILWIAAWNIAEEHLIL